MPEAPKLCQGIQYPLSGGLQFKMPEAQKKLVTVSLYKPEAQKKVGRRLNIFHFYRTTKKTKK